MNIRSIQVGMPREVMWNGKPVSTAIFKDPVEGPVEVLETHLKGDKQADPRYHGGPFKSVYLYPFEHYGFWEQELEDTPLPMGVFGENLTTTGLLEKDVRIGDIYQFGDTVQLKALQPRMPCFKLSVRFQDARMTQRFFQAGKFGIYFQVVQQGTIQAGDPIRLIRRSEYECTIQDLTQVFVSVEENRELIPKILEIPILPESLKASLEKRL